MPGTEVTVTVLQDDIDNGTRENSASCAVARALRRELAADSALVSGTALWVVREKGAQVADMPPEARVFVRAFDANLRVEPFKFRVTLWPVPPGGDRW